MGKPAVTPPSPAVLEAAKTHDLGAYVRGYVAVYRSSDKPPAGKGMNALMFVAVMAAAALPLVLGLLVAWWLGVLLLVAYAVGITVWLRRPKDLVHEFRHGLVARTRNEVVPVRWADATCVYQGVSQIYVNGVYGGTAHEYRLRMAAGRDVVLRGSVHEGDPDKSQTDIDELGEAVLREIPPRHLRAAVDTVNAGGEARFDGVTITLRGITVPQGSVAWRELRDLAAGSGIVWLHTANKKPWQVTIAEIPNFPVFWTLAKQLHTQSHHH
ncbi:DUF6585 family protein [Actinophytocola sp. KF-1]